MKCFTYLTFGFLFIFCNALPLDSGSDKSENVEYTTVNGNDSDKNLYVVKAVVYEVGILTDVSSEENDTSPDTQERVDLTFFDTHKNDSHIDLGKIPLPVQTNVSGQVLTAIAPINIGAFSKPSELLDTLPLTGTIVNISNSDTGYFQLSTHNLSSFDENTAPAPSLITADELEKISSVGDILPKFSNTNNNNNDQSSSTSSFSS